MFSFMVRSTGWRAVHADERPRHQASQGPSQDAQQDVMDDMTLDPDPLLREQQNDAILDAYGNVIFQPDFFGSFAGAAAPNHGDALTSNPAPVSFFMPPPPPAEQLAPSRAEQKAALASVQTRGALRQYLANNGASEMLFKRFADILEINAQAMPANAVRATALALKQPTDEILAAAMEQWDDYIDFAPIYPPFAVNALANMHSTPVQHASASPFAVNALAVQHASATPEGTVRPGEYEYRHGYALRVCYAHILTTSQLARHRRRALTRAHALRRRSPWRARVPSQVRTSCLLRAYADDVAARSTTPPASVHARPRPTARCA